MRNGWRFAGLVALAFSSSVRAGSTDADLAEVNRRWAGSVCVLQRALALSAKPDDGWLTAQTGGEIRQDRLAAINRVPGARRYIWILKVSDAPSSGSSLSGSVLPVGTAFVAQRWSFIAHKGVRLELRLRDAPVAAHIDFYSAEPRALMRLVGMDLVAEVERGLKVDGFFKVSSAEQRFPEASPASETNPASAVAAPAPAVAPLAPTAQALAIRILGVSVQPARTKPGEEIELILNYEVSGTTTETEVAEIRDLMRDDSLLTRLEARIRRTAGSYTSIQRMRLPAQLAPGIYTLHAQVTAGQSTADSNALFEVK